MRITFVLNHAEMSGGTRVIAVHAKLLQEMGHKVRVLSQPAPRRTPRQWLREVVRTRKIPGPLEIGPSHLDNCGVEHRLLDKYRPIEDRDVPNGDVVIATWWKTARWVHNLSPSKGAKAHLVQHFEDWGGSPIEGVNDAYRLPLHKICVSQWLQNLMREKFGAESHLVPNGVDIQQFDATPRGKQLTPTVGVMYSPIPFKGIDHSLAAFKLAKAKVPGLQLVSFGAEWPWTKLPEGTKFTRRPPQDKIKDIYAACDAWLIGSRAEGFGLPILEAMACRTPVIATPAGAAPELTAGGGGVLVDMNDPADMASQIVRIVTSEEAAWQQMSDAAYSTARRYTFADAARLLETAMKSIVGHGHGLSPSPGTPGEGRGEGDLELRKPFDVPNHSHPTVPELQEYRERESQISERASRKILVAKGARTA